MKVIHQLTKTRGDEAPAPTVDVTDLASELKTLRKGRALQSSQVVQRIGPTLRLVCAIADSDRPFEILHKLTNWLRDKIGILPSDLRISALAAFGLHQEVQLRFYQDRVMWVARQLARDPRTARRRIDEAIDCLAEMAVSSEIDAVILREHVDLPVELTSVLCGVADRDKVMCQCRIVAVGQAMDSRGRFFAVVEMLEDETIIAIPATRIGRVVPNDGTFAATLWNRADDRHARRDLAAQSG